MTEWEAIEELSNELRIINDMISYCRIFEDESDIALAYLTKEKDATEMAIIALKEIQQYRKIGTVEECREAMEKQMPVKPKEMLRHKMRIRTYHCQNCGYDFCKDERYTIKEEYCSACGKLLDSSFRSFCGNCGQAIENENLEGMEDE